MQDPPAQETQVRKKTCSRRNISVHRVPVQGLRKSLQATEEKMEKLAGTQENQVPLQAHGDFDDQDSTQREPVSQSRAGT